ncbi:MAG: ATP-binding protein [Pseudomonadota bacterium]
MSDRAKSEATSRWDGSWVDAMRHGGGPRIDQTFAVPGAFLAGLLVTAVFLPLEFGWIAIALAGVAVCGGGYMITRISRGRRRNLFSESIEVMPIPIAIYDRSGRLAASNQLYRDHHDAAFRRRRARGETRRPTYRELITDGVDPSLPEEEIRARVEQRIADQPPEDGHLVERWYAGIGWLRLARTKLPSGGAVRVAISVTELKEREAELLQAVERAKASEAARDKFLSTMTHELRTPLNGVIGMAAVLLNGDLDDAARRNVELIRGSGMHLLDLVDRVLDFSKLDHGPRAKEETEFDLVAMADEVLAEARFARNASGLTLRLEVAPAFAARRVGDRQGIRQIVTNLVGNAVKFTEAGEVALMIGGEETGTVSVSVRDTGIGIPADKQDAIFQPFEQADGSMTRRFGGTGLGLSICTEIATALGGVIEVESEAGSGATFTLRLPLPIAEEAAAAAENSAVS